MGVAGALLVRANGSRQQSAYTVRISFEYPGAAPNLLDVMAMMRRRRMIMKRELHHDGLIDLGAASIETKGPTFGKDDALVGQIPREGLSDE